MIDNSYSLPQGGWKRRYDVIGAGGTDLPLRVWDLKF